MTLMSLLDVDLVPMHDLPLQAVLKFQPCSSAAAASYLQLICMAQGHLVEFELLRQLYDTTHCLSSIDIPDEPLNPRTEGLPSKDLRRAIHSLQLYCSVDNEFPESLKSRDDAMGRTLLADNISIIDAEKQTRVLSDLYQHTDRLSFMDAFLSRPPLDSPEVSKH
jgi:hypothetical protein